jgi:hypothetical protein
LSGPTHKVWYRLTCESAFGIQHPVDAILLTPEHPTDGAPDLAARVERIEQMLRQAFGGEEKAG